MSASQSDGETRFKGHYYVRHTNRTRWNACFNRYVRNIVRLHQRTMPRRLCECHACDASRSDGQCMEKNVVDSMSCSNVWWIVRWRNQKTSKRSLCGTLSRCKCNESNAMNALRLWVRITAESTEKWCRQAWTRFSHHFVNARILGREASPPSITTWR